MEFDRQHPHDGSLEAFLEQIALISDTDAWEDSSDRVSLMTLHAAKGLEFPCVYIVGIEDEVLPHHRCRNDPMQYEEERRLLFVGITRAEQTLQLSMAKKRSVRGDMRPVAASPFLLELPNEDMEVIDSSPYGSSLNNDFDVDVEYPESWDIEVDQSDDDDVNQLSQEDRIAESTSTPNAPSLGSLKTAADLMASQQQFDMVQPEIYSTGMIVTHPEYGSGRIVSLSGSGKRRMASVEFFMDGLEQSFVLAHAKLTPETES